MQFDRAKLSALILYACTKCESANLGAVKLHKVLYFSDMLHFAESGSPITGSTYRKRPFGPTCDQLLSTLSHLTEAKALRIEEVEYFGYKKKQFVSLTEPDTAKLNSEELALINEVIDFVCVENSAKTISEFSHNRAWELAEFGESLPYTSVFQIFPTQVSLDAIEWARGEADQIADQRSKADPLGYASFADFRSRVLETRRLSQ